MIKILGRTDSINVRKVLWLCDELHLPYQREDWGRGFRSPKEQEFIQLNPNATIPVLIDEELTLWQSNSIIRFWPMLMMVQHFIRQSRKHVHLLINGLTGKGLSSITVGSMP